MWRRLTGRRDRLSEARDELDAHIRMAIRDRTAAGESEADATRHAHVELGSLRGTLEDAQRVWRPARIEQFLFDLRSGARILRTAPGLSLTAILLIALVIGGNTTIYSAVHAMLTKPAPGIEPNQLGVIRWSIGDGRMFGPDTTLAHAEALRESRLAHTAAFRFESVALTLPDGTFGVRGAAVSVDYFGVLGVPFVRGRGFAPSESHLGPRGLVAVISARLWQRQFAGREDIIGSAVRLNGQPATIAGVVADPFQGVWLADATDVWMPLHAFAQASSQDAQLGEGPSIHGVIVRRREGASAADVEAELRAIAAATHAALPGGGLRYEPSLVDYTGIAGRNNMLARFGPRFLAIFSIVTLLTVCIVCANVANLMLARAVSRQREMAVRQSFGASRWRITRLVLAENLTIAMAAWAAACLFAYWVSRLLPGLIPASESGGAEVLLDFTPDWRVLAYAMLLALAAAVTFTIAPALRTWRLDLLSFLKAGERGVLQGRGRPTRVLVVVQLALAVVLLTGAGLAYRSLTLLSGQQLGYDSSNVLLVTVDMTAAARTAAAKLPLLQSMLEAVRSVPVVSSASYALQAPSQAWSTRPVTSVAGAQPVIAERNEVGPDFLSTLGVMPLRGVEFGTNHGAGAQRQAVVNKNLADALWPNESPLGKSLHLGNLDGAATVIGVLPNALVGGYRRDERPLLALLSARQTERAGSYMTFYLRYRGGLDDAVPAITRAMRDAAPQVPVTYMRTLDGTLHDMTWIYRALTTLLLLFAGGSLAIAALGQYAAMSFATRQRMRDFAIRIAMGATARQVLTSAMREGLVLTGAGLAAGLALGTMAGISGRALLHGVTPTDATTYAGVLFLLGASSLAACYLPARRAARVDPIDALRAE